MKKENKTETETETETEDNSSAMSETDPEPKSRKEEYEPESTFWSTLINNVNDFIYFKDTNSRHIHLNKVLANHYGVENPEDAVGKTDFNFYPEELARQFFEDEQAIMHGGEPVINKIEKVGDSSSEFRWISTTKVPVYDKTGKVMGIAGISRDVTELKQMEEKLARNMENLEELVTERTRELSQKAQEILDLSTPIMQLWHGIVVAPLIGVIDSERTQQFTERLLRMIVDTDSPVAIVDITGVPVIDTNTAQHLIDTITSVRLLGSQVILTGVRPSITQTLAHLAIDMSNIISCSSLKIGLKIALNEVNFDIIKKA